MYVRAAHLGIVVRVHGHFWWTRALVNVDEVGSIKNDSCAASIDELLDAGILARLYDGARALNVDLLADILAGSRPGRGRVNDRRHAALAECARERLERGEIARLE